MEKSEVIVFHFAGQFLLTLGFHSPLYSYTNNSEQCEHLFLMLTFLPFQKISLRKCRCFLEVRCK